MPDQHRDFFRNTAIALVIAALAALFAQPTTIRVYVACICLFSGTVFLIRAVRPQWFGRTIHPAIRLDNQNVLQRDPPAYHVSLMAWLLALLLCVASSTTVTLLFRAYGPRGSSQPLISLGDVKQTIDDELARWWKDHQPPAQTARGGVDGSGNAQISSRQRHLTAKTAFSFALESELTTGAAGFPTYFTGFWVGHPSTDGYRLLPVTTFAYVRITNLQPTRTMIKRLNASLRECSDRDRIDTLYGDVFITFAHSKSAFVPRLGATFAFPFEGTGGYGFAAQISDADLSRAVKLSLPLLDRQLSEHYLDPHEEIGGWVPFDSSCGPTPLTMTIEDVAGDPLFTYHLERVDKTMTGDLAQRTMTTEAPADLSKAQIDYSSAILAFIEKKKAK